MDFEVLVEVTRGPLVESRHLGAAAVVDAAGSLLFSVGNPDLVTYLRSSAKPMQAVAVVESGAAAAYGFSPREIAIFAASHNGEEMHTTTVSRILARLGLDNRSLACGVHEPLHKATAERLREAGEAPSVLHNNCSGKHAGMLALARQMGVPTEGYYRPEHPVQQRILATVASLTGMAPSEIAVGVDGCGVPVFGMPLRSAALAFARLADPRQLAPERAAAVRQVVSAMQSNPEMVAGTDRFDTDLMRQTRPRVFCKGGAEGYYALGLLPDPTAGRPVGVGLALKVVDGDRDGRARPVAVMEALRQLGVLTDEDLTALAIYRSVEARNHRGDVVGQVRPAVVLHRT
jgi:L-asparaginase II